MAQMCEYPGCDIEKRVAKQLLVKDRASIFLCHGHALQLIRENGILVYCGGCVQWKPPEAFSKNRGRANGLDSQCRLCLNKQHREYRRLQKSAYMQAGIKYPDPVHYNQKESRICANPACHRGPDGSPKQFHPRYDKDRDHRFCCPQCRVEGLVAERAHAPKKPKKLPDPKPCEICGNAFIPAAATQSTCSTACSGILRSRLLKGKPQRKRAKVLG